MPKPDYFGSKENSPATSSARHVAWLKLCQAAKITLALRDILAGKYCIEVALTDEQRHESYQLRGEVFGKELGYEQPKAGGIEYDHHDTSGRATTLLVRERSSNRAVGCIRLIHGSKHTENEALPVLQLGQQQRTLDVAALNATRYQKYSYGEISRMTVLHDFRHGQNESGKRSASSVPFIMLGFGIMALARHEGMKHVFMLVEPRLMQRVATMGAPVIPIGTPVEHRGQRIPCIIPLRGIVGQQNTITRILYRHIRNQVVRSIRRRDGAEWMDTKSVANQASPPAMTMQQPARRGWAQLKPHGTPVSSQPSDFVDLDSQPAALPAQHQPTRPSLARVVSAAWTPSRH